MNRLSPQTVISTSVFIRQAKKAGISEEEMKDICDTIASDPQAGSVIENTGGARKLRHPTKDGGKSGGYRTIHYWGGDDIPVFLLSVYGKGQKASLTKAEKNELRKILPGIGDAYRKNVKREAAKRRRSRK